MRQGSLETSHTLYLLSNERAPLVVGLPGQRKSPARGGARVLLGLWLRHAKEKAAPEGGHLVAVSLGLRGWRRGLEDRAGLERDGTWSLGA